MKVLIDQFYLTRLIQKPEDFNKVLSVPSASSILNLVSKPYTSKDFIENLPESWLSDELFFILMEKLMSDGRYKTVERFVKSGKLPKLTEEQKIELIKKARAVIQFFPELRYDVWLKYADSIKHSDSIPAAYRTQDMLIAVMGADGEITPDLMTDALIDAYIDINETLNHIPDDRITLERVKKILSKHPSEDLSEDQMKGIVVDEELSGLLTGKAKNFEFIPDVYRTRARLVNIIVNESKIDRRSSFWNTGIPKFLKKKNWLGTKFYLEVLEKAGDAGVLSIKAIHDELRTVGDVQKSQVALDMTALVKAYPGAIKYVNKTEQNKTMADAVLGSARANELKDFLSLKFITKATSPLFLSSENEDIVGKVERVLTGVPYKKKEPVYSIPSGHEAECDLTDEDITRLRNTNTPFII